MNIFRHACIDRVRRTALHKIRPIPIIKPVSKRGTTPDLAYMVRWRRGAKLGFAFSVLRYPDHHAGGFIYLPINNDAWGRWYNEYHQGPH